MASGYPSIFLLLLLFLATASIAQAGLGIFGRSYSQIAIQGIFAYPDKPNVGVAGAIVRLSCDGGLNVLDNGLPLTGPDGSFEVVATGAGGPFFDLSKCSVYVIDPTANLYYSALNKVQIQPIVGLLGDQTAVCKLTGVFQSVF